MSRHIENRSTRQLRRWENYALGGTSPNCSYSAHFVVFMQRIGQAPTRQRQFRR